VLGRWSTVETLNATVCGWGSMVATSSAVETSGVRTKATSINVVKTLPKVDGEPLEALLLHLLQMSAASLDGARR
jgi:hypothetical protein